MPTIRRLKKDHDFQYWGDRDSHCNSCQYYEYDETYEGVDGMSAHHCNLYREEDGGAMIILLDGFGGCDANS